MTPLRKALWGSLVIASLATSLLLFALLNRQALTATSEEAKGFVTALARQIDEQLRHTAEAVETLARGPEFAVLPAHAATESELHDPTEGRNGAPRKRLHTALAENRDLAMIFLSDPAGAPYFMEPRPLEESEDRCSLARRAAIEEAVRTRKTAISDVFRAEDGHQVVVIDVPLQDASGALRGHLGGVMHLDRLFAPVAERLTASRDALALLDRQGHLVAGSHPDLTRYAATPDFSALADITGIGADRHRGLAAPSEPVHHHFLTPEDGRTFMVFPVALDQGWKLLLFKDHDLLSARARDNALWTSLAAGALLMLFGGLGILLHGQRTRS